MTTKKMTSSIFILLMMIGCATAKPIHRNPKFIGGEAPDRSILGLVRLGAGDFVFRECTATMIDAKFFLTAVHCFGHDPNTLLNIDYVYPPPFFETIDVVLEEGTIQRQKLVIKKVHLFPQAVHGSDAEKIPGNTEEMFGHIIEVGDIAIVELQKPIQGLKKFPKILFRALKSDQLLWVGGFGKKQQASETFLDSTYTGGFARFGNERNSFFTEGVAEFRKESSVSVEMVNVENEISYAGKGDSGGGVFSKVGGEYYVVGVNHAGRFGRAQGLKLDPTSGKVLERSKDHDGDIIGYAHCFLKSNKQLLAWVSRILPKDRVVIEQ